MKKRFFLFLIILIWLFTYLPNLSRYPYGGDSSEFATTMTTWGIAHPPGYPLYNLLGNIFHQLPFQFNIYAKLSLLSAFFNLITAFNIFFLVYFLIKNKPSAFMAAVLYLFFFPVWLYGLVPEVFALANCLISFQLLMLFKSGRRSKYLNRYLVIFFLSIGLSVAHHHLVVFFLPGYIYYIWKTPVLKRQIIKNKLRYLLTILIGSSCYLYVFIVAKLNTPLDIENAKTLSGFFNLFFRTSYGTFKAYSQVQPNLLNSLFDLFSVFVFLIHDIKPLGLFLAIWGIVYFKKNNRLVLSTLIILSISLLFFFFYSNFYLNTAFTVATYERFLVFLYLVIIIFIGTGIYYLHTVLINWIGAKTKKIVIINLARFLFGFMILCYTLNSLYNNYQTIKELPQTKEFINYASDLLKTPPQNSLLFLSSDHNVFLADHLQLYYHYRPDLTIIPYLLDRDYIRQRLKQKNPQIVFSQNNDFGGFLKLNYQKKQLIFSDRPHPEGFWINYGLLWKYYPDKEEYQKDSVNIYEKNKYLWSNYHLKFGRKLTKNLLFVKDIYDIYSRQIWVYLYYLTVNNKQDEALNFSNTHFSEFSSDRLFIIAYLDLHIKAKQCQNLKPLIDQVENQTFSKAFEYLPLVDYYENCQPDAKKKQEYIYLYNKLKAAEQ